MAEPEIIPPERPRTGCKRTVEALSTVIEAQATPQASGNANPTEETYGPLQAAFDHFNRELFGGRLPYCLITLQRSGKQTYGYFESSKFVARDTAMRTDEIALNPRHFREPVREVCGTLVHEMVHLAQHYFGKPPRRGYHDEQWAVWMRQVGLQPSSSSEPGGKQTGYHMGHYIVAGGQFDESFARFEAAGGTLRWADMPTADDNEEPKPKRLKFVCPCCKQNVHGVSSTDVRCNRCNLVMVAT